MEYNASGSRKTSSVDKQHIQQRCASKVTVPGTQRSSCEELKLKNATVAFDKHLNNTFRGSILPTKISAPILSPKNNSPFIIKPKTVPRIISKSSRQSDSSVGQRSFSRCTGNTSNANSHPYAHEQSHSRSATASLTPSPKLWRSNVYPGSFSVTGMHIPLHDDIHIGDVIQKRPHFLPANIFSINSIDNRNNREECNECVSSQHTEEAEQRTRMHICSGIDMSTFVDVPCKLKTVASGFRMPRQKINRTKYYDAPIKDNHKKQERHGYQTKHVSTKPQPLRTASSFLSPCEARDIEPEIEHTPCCEYTPSENVDKTSNDDDPLLPFSIEEIQDEINNIAKIETEEESSQTMNVSLANESIQIYSTCLYCHIGQLNGSEACLPNVICSNGELSIDDLPQACSFANSSAAKSETLVKLTTKDYHKKFTRTDQPIHSATSQVTLPVHEPWVKSQPPASIDLYSLSLEQSEKHSQSITSSSASVSHVNPSFTSSTPQMKKLTADTKKQSFNSPLELKLKSTDIANVDSRCITKSAFTIVTQTSQCITRANDTVTNTKPLGPNLFYANQKQIFSGKKQATTGDTNDLPSEVIVSKPKPQNNSDHSYISKTILPPVFTDNTRKILSSKNEWFSAPIEHEQDLTTFPEIDNNVDSDEMTGMIEMIDKTDIVEENVTIQINVLGNCNRFPVEKTTENWSLGEKGLNKCRKNDSSVSIMSHNRKNVISPAAASESDLRWTKARANDSNNKEQPNNSTLTQDRFHKYKKCRSNLSKKQRFFKLLRLCPKSHITLDKISKMERSVVEMQLTEHKYKERGVRECMSDKVHSQEFSALSVQILKDKNDRCSFNLCKIKVLLDSKMSTVKRLSNGDYPGKIMFQNGDYPTFCRISACNFKPGFYIISETGPKLTLTENEDIVSVIFSPYLPNINSLPNRTHAVAIGKLYPSDDETGRYLDAYDNEVGCLEDLLSVILPLESLKDVRPRDVAYLSDTRYRPKTENYFWNTEKYAECLLLDNRRKNSPYKTNSLSEVMGISTKKELKTMNKSDNKLSNTSLKEHKNIVPKMKITFGKTNQKKPSKKSLKQQKKTSSVKRQRKRK